LGRGMKRSVIVGIIPLAALLALSACTTEPTPTPTPSQAAPTPSPSASREESASPTPSPSTVPTNPADPEVDSSAWTAKTAYDACAEFQLDLIEKDGYDPDNVNYEPWADDGEVRRNGTDWVVDITGTVRDSDGKEHVTYTSCTVSGTPESPKIENLPGV
jgi:hypothetical protein